MNYYLRRAVRRLTIILFMCGCVDEEKTRMKTDEITGVDIENEAMVTVSKSASRSTGLEVVRLSGKVRYFGLDILQSPPVRHPLVGIPDVQVWFAEYPFTKELDIRTDEDGKWEIHILKQSGLTFEISVMYEKDHYPEELEQMVFPDGLPEGWERTLIKSNVYVIESDDVEDMAMQMPDEVYLFYAKSQLEAGISELVGAPYDIENFVVATVGKAWASIYDPALPHGDPGAEVVISPALPSPLSGPIYFDETVTPSPTFPATSVDGGVLFNNLAPGNYTMTAIKEPYQYDEIEFVVDSKANLYIASPPHAIQGDNTSGPGEP